MICFVAINENDDEGSETKVNDQNPSYVIYFALLKEMHEDIKKLLKGNKLLKNKCSSLSKMNENVSDEMSY